jgi:hypothetical protein
MSSGEAVSDAASVCAPSIAELEPSPNKDTHDEASLSNLTWLTSGRSGVEMVLG